jgi:photosystem II stability/assembly factor-like uncharacterized protein
MKQTRFPLFRIALLAAAVAGISTMMSAQQWTALRSPVSGVDLFSVHFFSHDTGFVCGRRGTATGVLYSTANAGVSWSQIALPGTPLSLNDLCFLPSSGFGAVAGDDGYVAVTTDRGRSWSLRPVGGSTWSGGGDIQAVWFRSSSVGFVVGRAAGGNGPRLARTTDAGVTWINVPQNDPPNNNLYDLDFFDQLHGVAVGTGSPPRRSLTSDGGATWEPAATMSAGAGESAESKSMYGVDAVSGTSTAYAAGGRNYGSISGRYADVRRTTDFGSTWTRTRMSGDSVNYNHPASDVLALSAALAYVSAQKGRLYRTIDSGSSWTRELLPSSVTTSHDLRKFSLAGDNTIFVAGTGGTLLSARLIPDATFSSDTIDLGLVCPSSSVTGSLQIGNAGSGILQIDSTSITGNTAPGVTFSTDLVPRSISAGTSSPLRLRVTATTTAAPGIYRATLRVRSNDENYTGRDTLKLVTLVARVGTRALTLNTAVSRDAGSVRYGGAYNSILDLARILRSSGDCPVTISSVALRTGSEFIVQAFSPATYRPGDDFSIGLYFVPARGCRRDDTLLVYHDGAGSPIRIGISGTGTEPSFRMLPRDRDTIDFGRVLVGSSAVRTLRLLNDAPGLCLDSTWVTRTSLLGSGRTTFQLGRSLPPVAQIPPQGEIAIPITAAPAALGASTAFVVVSHEVTATSPDTVWLRVVGVQPELTTLNSEIIWGATVAGGGGDSLLSGFLQNRGGVDAEVVRANISGSDASSFSYASPATPFTVAVDATADMRVGFRPRRQGAHDAMLTLDVRYPNGTERQIFVRLGGRGESPAIAARSGEIVFGTTPVNRCADTTLVRFLYNRGTVPLSIRSIRTGYDPQGSIGDSLAFRIVSPLLPPTIEIQPGDSLSITLQFCPKRPGYHQARLLVSNTTAGDDSLFTVALRGNGRSSSFTTVSEIRFAPTRVLTQRDSTIVGFFFNDQPGDLFIDSIRIGGGLDSTSFSLSSPSGAFSISPGRASSIRIRFAPQRRGYHETFLYVYASSARTPYQVVLKGTAIYPYLTIAPRDPQSLRIRPGTGRRVEFDLANTGDDSARVESLAFSGPLVFQNPTTGPIPTTLLPGATLPIFVDVVPDRLCEIEGRLSVRAEGVRGVYGLQDTTVVVSAVGIAPRLEARRPEITLGIAPVGGSRDSALADFLGNLDMATGSADCVDDTRIDSIVVSGGDAGLFGITAPADPAAARSLAAGRFQPLGLRFSPVSTGRFRSTLRIYSEGRTDSVLSIDLFGASSPLPIDFGPGIELDFGPVPIGSMKDSSFTIVNRSASPLTLDRLTLPSPSDFRLLSPTSSAALLPGSAVTVVIRFEPTGSAGVRRAPVEISAEGEIDSSFVVRGSAIRDNLSSSARSVDFGSRPAGSVIDTMVILLDRAGGSIQDGSLIDTARLDDVTIDSDDGAFTLLSSPAMLPPGGIDSIGVRFTAVGATGSRDGMLRIYHNKHLENGIPMRDSIVIPLHAGVGNRGVVIDLALGDDIVGSPGDRITIPILLDGDLAAAAVHDLQLELRFNPRLLKPLAARSTLAGVSATLLADDSRFPNGEGRIIMLASASALPSGRVAELDMTMLLGDVLVSDLSIAAAPIAGTTFNPDTLTVTSSFCEADARRVLVGGSGILKIDPNPARDQVTIDIETAAAGVTTLSLYNGLGQEIGRPLEREIPAGRSSIVVELGDLPDGIYFAVLRSGRFSFTGMIQVTR